MEEIAENQELVPISSTKQNPSSFVDSSNSNKIHDNQVSVDVSETLTNETQTEAQSKAPASNASLDLINLDESSVENEIKPNTVPIPVKSQKSDCSIITLSSEASEEVALETYNKNAESDDENMSFERSISCPPMQLPDCLFESNSTDGIENVQTDNQNECKNLNMHSL